jgi:energy-coupling factor transport system substrate-specific component
MKPTVREIAVFGVLGALMFALNLAMEALPNIHLVGVFIIAATAVYRQKALYPLYVYVLLNGLYAGFSLWWIP